MSVADAGENSSSVEVGVRIWLDRGRLFLLSPIHSFICHLILFILILILSASHQTMSSPLDDCTEHLLDVDGYANGNGTDLAKPKFKIRNLTRVSDDGVLILKGINVDIPKGVIVGVIGPSGSGKSTLLRALNRLWEPPSSSVFLDGADICDHDVLSLRRKVGMLFQLPALFEGTVADNVRYGPQLRGKKLTDDEVRKLLIMADLDASFMDKSGAELSVGQAQRVALARTLANSPEVLLLDEPTSALDPISTENIEDALMKLNKNRSITVIMVSHSIKQIQRIADIVCLLVDGEIVEVLKPDKLSEAKHPMAQRFLQLSS
ncbi:ABC transporter I family member 17 [Abrus precatorius]|uniref:ABC transporter I family member 17 n=1 Tax=Abrus precatorius TaxID=3816 RepID=A0A8B8K9T5_ABRPR|nr:ABC transporter I family member 17 [Abrus precatorius]